MDQIELDEIKRVVRKRKYGSCLCGHFESCSNCNGETDRILEAACERLDKAFRKRIK